MAQTIPDSLLRQFSGFLAARMGLSFPPSRWPDMLRGLERAARAFDRPGPEACMQWLLAAPLERPQVEILASYLTVGETYFYREQAVFAALEREVLPPLIAARRAAGRHLRIWSAGCCTGEEPYSLAILLCRMIPDIEQWNISLLATDINPHFLARAMRGEYREWSFRAAPAWLREGYFERSAAGNFAISPRLRRLVSFDYLNLVDDVYPSLGNHTNGMDLVLCRNVLMYFEGDAMRAVVDKLRRSLTEGGWLAVSPTEASTALLSGFAAVEFEDAILYRKSGEHTALAPVLRREPPPSSAPTIWIELPAPTPPPAVPAAETAVPPPLPPAPAPALAADKAYDEALRCYAQGDYAQAAALLATANADPRGLALAARACANLGRLDEACRWCEAAVAADKCSPGLRYLLASVLAEQGHAEASAATLKQALYLDQDFVLAHFALGNMCRRQGKLALAARHFANARQLLAGLSPASTLPDAEGLTAGRLLAIIDSEECIA